LTQIFDEGIISQDSIDDAISDAIVVIDSIGDDIPHIQDIQDIPHIPHIQDIPHIPHIPHIPDIQDISEIKHHFSMSKELENGGFITYSFIGLMVKIENIEYNPTGHDMKIQLLFKNNNCRKETIAGVPDGCFIIQKSMQKIQSNGMVQFKFRYSNVCL
jgi:hypothetical protein